MGPQSETPPPMAKSESTPTDATPQQRLASIDQRQDDLLAELDRLNTRVEAALAAWAKPPAQKPVA